MNVINKTDNAIDTINKRYASILNDNKYTDDLKNNPECDGKNNGVAVYDKLTALFEITLAQWLNLCLKTSAKTVQTSPINREPPVPTLPLTKPQRRCVFEALKPLEEAHKKLENEIDENRSFFSGKQCFFFYTRLHLIKVLHQQTRQVVGRAYALNPPPK